MSRRRFIADEVSADRASLLGAHAAHLVRVLRARIGQEFDIAADGHVRRGVIISVSDGRVDFELGKEIGSVSDIPVTVWLAVFKFDRMEWAIEKCTELGAANIVPLIASRTDTHLAAAAEKRVERWRRLALQASEQSRRVSPPEIVAPIRLKRESVAPASSPAGPIANAGSKEHKQGTPAQSDLLAGGGVRIVLAESEDRLTLRDALEQRSESGERTPIHLAIGPEGGWTAPELKMFEDCGWIAASLGHTILRAETAAIAALSIAMSELQ